MYSVELETRTVTYLDAQHMAAPTTIVAFFAGGDVCGSTIITAVRQNVFPLVYRLLGKLKFMKHVTFPLSLLRNFRFFISTEYITMDRCTVYTRKKPVSH